MLRIHCTTEDLLKVTFADQPAPLVELGLLFETLRHRDTHPVFSLWRQRVIRALPRSARPVLRLVSSLNPGPPVPPPRGHDFGEGLAETWPRIHAGFHAEIAWRARVLAQRG